ncbi:hypothetical protein DL95DRAFT_460511 [Leptodontidium sp. 2 PMI_412]|nr:hypothetical protein DL95DRAFT_460511 [Leptodontidium sp. 2 PMI_412]
MAENIPTRLIVCVDGTWCTADGPRRSDYQNNSNIYRLCASIKTGVVTDISGQKFKQVKHYAAGIGSSDDIAVLERLRTGIFGAECIKQIKQIYELCCVEASHPQDEVWLYGFSRGAYVVRAVAGLLHYLRALTSAGTPAFDHDYSKALRVYEAMQKARRAENAKLGPGQIHDFLGASSRSAPRIRFLGAFDTVKVVNDRSLYDISFSESIENLRHALALNENRKDFMPECMYPEFGKDRLLKRSFLQMWFLGAHIDIGGSAANDGLSLYPLQWMLLESEAKGLVLEFDGSFASRAHIDNPLHVVFPDHELQGKGVDLWKCHAGNGVVVQMQDLRKVHNLVEYKQRYKIRLNKHRGVYWKRLSREPFNSNGELKGYCKYAPQGTLLHPSVFLAFDEYCHILLDSKDMFYRKEIEAWRPTILPDSTADFWHNEEVLSIEGPGVIRVLVCGNVGVGKSSLINAVFGLPVTVSSDRERGDHDISTPFTTPDRPDLLVHDSSGFEAGGQRELRAVKNFVSDRASRTEMADRLHLIWFCLELNSARTKQKGTTELFKTISQYAEDVPIVVVATKKDEFLGVKLMEARKKISGVGKDPVAYWTELEVYAENEYVKRMELIEKELHEIEGGRFDAAVGISKDDTDTIGVLTETTSSCFNHERLRRFYISAQVTRIDMKVDLAISETIRIYKHTVRGAAAAAFFPGGATTNRITVAAVVCNAIVTCFGVPTVSSETVLAILRSVIWEDIGQNFSLLLAESISTLGLLSTIALGGMPVFLASGLVNAPLVIPATTRLFLMLACDTILILVKAFKASTDRCIGQPLKSDIEKAAYEYRPLSKQVHKQIKKVVPRRNMVKSFQSTRIKKEIEDILADYKNVLTQGIGHDAKILDEDTDSEMESSLVGDFEKVKL